MPSEPAQGAPKSTKDAGKEAPITPRAKDYAEWYQDVVTLGGLAEQAGVVRGCMVIKPHGYAIWERIQRTLDAMFKDSGHHNAYFPLFIPESFIRKEQHHVEGFSPELAVVTHGGGKQLEEPYVVRPTSETIIGHFFAKWINSYRDLPLLINQWANVVRWEMRTRLFLRTTEFLWQEGHTAHATEADAEAETLRMLRIYHRFAEDYMAMPVIAGLKTDAERFAGAIRTYSIEAMMQDGKALQAGTSHNLGQNFGKAFDVTYLDPEGTRQYVWQTSWGVSTRLIGGLVMTHSDDKGLILPPRMAPLHVVIVPVLGSGGDADWQRVVETSHKLAADLKRQELPTEARLREVIEVHVDDRRELRPGAKYFEWERKGVPVRLEIGPKDLEKQQVSMRRRHSEAREALPLDGAAAAMPQVLMDMQRELFELAKKRRGALTVNVDSWQEFLEVFRDQESKFVWAHWDGTAATEAKIKEETKVTVRCLPLPEFAPPGEAGKCVYSGQPSPRRVLFAKAY